MTQSEDIVGLKQQAAVGIKVTRRAVREFLEEADKKFGAILQDCGLEVAAAATDSIRIQGFQAAVKALYEAAQDR